MGSILIADDAREVREHLARALARDHRVVAVDSGTAALDAILTDRFDLAILDAVLAGIGGLDVARRLREIDLPDAPPIVLCTGLYGAARLRGPLRAAMGIHAILHKPFTERRLRATVSELLAGLAFDGPARAPQGAVRADAATAADPHPALVVAVGRADEATAVLREVDTAGRAVVRTVDRSAASSLLRNGPVPDFALAAPRSDADHETIALLSRADVPVLEHRSEIEERLDRARRHHVRVPIRTELGLHLGAASIYGDAVDVSEGGVGVVLRARVAVGSPAAVEVDLADGGGRLVAAASVVWTAPAAERSWRVGLALRDLSDEARGRLRDRVARGIRHAGFRSWRESTLEAAS